MSAARVRDIFSDLPVWIDIMFQTVWASALPPANNPAGQYQPTVREWRQARTASDDGFKPPGLILSDAGHLAGLPRRAADHRVS
jgi:hypothetical protein